MMWKRSTFGSLWRLLAWCSAGWCLLSAGRSSWVRRWAPWAQSWLSWWAQRSWLELRLLLWRARLSWVLSSSWWSLSRAPWWNLLSLRSRWCWWRLRCLWWGWVARMTRRIRGQGRHPSMQDNPPR